MAKMKDSLTQLHSDVSNLIECASKAKYVKSDIGNDLIQKGKHI